VSPPVHEDQLSKSNKLDAEAIWLYAMTSLLFLIAKTFVVVVVLLVQRNVLDPPPRARGSVDFIDKPESSNL
jgi:hypothetical protein